MVCRLQRPLTGDLARKRARMRGLGKKFIWLLSLTVAFWLAGCGKSPTPASPEVRRTVKKAFLRGDAEVEFTKVGYRTAENCLQFVSQDSGNSLEFLAGTCGLGYVAFSLPVDASGAIRFNGVVVGQYQSSTSEIFVLCSSPYLNACTPTISNGSAIGLAP